MQNFMHLIYRRRVSLVRRQQCSKRYAGERVNRRIHFICNGFGGTCYGFRVCFQNLTLQIIHSRRQFDCGQADWWNGGSRFGSEPWFHWCALQSVSFDGYIQSKRDRPNCLSENGGLSCWVIDLTNCWTFVHCPQVLCGCHSGLKCHMLTISPLAKGHQLKQKEKVKCINVRVVDFDFRPWRCLVEFFTKFY